MRILVTGFEPFGRLVDNPSQHLLEQLSAADFDAAAQLHPERLPTSYRGSERRIRELLDELQPQLCICLGVAQNRRAVCLERIAVNIDDCSLPDNDGVLLGGREIVPGAALALQSPLDLAALLQPEDAAGGEQPLLPVAISNHAGNFVCDHVYYAALQHIQQTGLACRCVFIHVPMTAECSGPGEEYGWELPSQQELGRTVSQLGRRIAALLRTGAAEVNSGQPAGTD